MHLTLSLHHGRKTLQHIGSSSTKQKIKPSTNRVIQTAGHKTDFLSSGNLNCDSAIICQRSFYCTGACTLSAAKNQANQPLMINNF